MGRRRTEAEEHENHERWLVSYADFITLLFAFFVVMYSLSSVNEGKYRVLSDSLVQAFRSVSVNESGTQMVVQPMPVTTGPIPVPKLDRAKAAAEQAKQRAREAAVKKVRNMADEIRRVLKPLSEGGQVLVTEGANGIKVEINAEVLFAPGEALLGAPAVSALSAVAQVLSEAEFPIIIEGHTDNVPINTYRFPSNWELSAVRASSVVRLFVNAGVAPSRLTAAGYGDQRPVADNDTPESRSRNRRVTLLIESMLVDEDLPPVVPLRRDDAIQTILPSASAEPPAARSSVN
ncbi:flagellar motor protein MotD [Denitromonas iodatirespirans]|uniref:Flagellar motor protein MotD n=1 Tax=Denitromonas iodatirespirans TaxID=2795389 RepID=A0A944DBF9_DENI1|nr:flagellar motor protein MotD [Denitromonas iodatirespirans]MBT0959628.1 flagellar motor protein MotD [Denitromonas iodatirespirans]